MGQMADDLPPPDPPPAGTQGLIRTPSLVARQDAASAEAKAEAAVEAASEAQAKATLAAKKLASVSRSNARRKVSMQLHSAKRRSSRLEGAALAEPGSPAAATEELKEQVASTVEKAEAEAALRAEEEVIARCCAAAVTTHHHAFQCALTQINSKP